MGSDEGEQRQAVEQVTELLADLGAQLAEVLPAGAAEVEEVRLQLGCVRLQEVLPAAGGRMLDLPALLGLLDWAGHLVLRFGAPARDQSAAAGQAAVRRQLASAGADPAAVAAVAVRGLRLLAAQLKLLRLDAGESRLAAEQGGSCGVLWAAVVHGWHRSQLMCSMLPLKPPPPLPPILQPISSCGFWPGSCAQMALPPMPPPNLRRCWAAPRAAAPSSWASACHTRALGWLLHLGSCRPWSRWRRCSSMSPALLRRHRHQPCHS